MLALPPARPIFSLVSGSDFLGQTPGFCLNNFTPSRQAAKVIPHFERNTMK